MAKFDCIETNNIEQMKSQLSRYFSNLAMGIEKDCATYDSAFDLLQFATLDMITSWFYSLPIDGLYRQKFIDNLLTIAKTCNRYGDRHGNKKIQNN